MSFDFNKYFKLKKVSFSNINNIILIPSNNDYKEYNLIYELWYSENDYIKFKDDFINEINILYKLYPTLNIEEVKYKLYNVSSNDYS
jgi:hypothetical protein